MSIIGAIVVKWICADLSTRSNSCTKWRLAALSTHSRFLWSEIHLAWPKAVVERYFERSAGKSIELSIAMNRSSFTSGNFSHFKERLISSYPRIARLNIQWDQTYTVNDPAPDEPELLSWMSETLGGSQKAKTLWQLRLYADTSRSFGSELVKLANLPRLSDIHFDPFSFDASSLHHTSLTTVNVHLPRYVTSLDIFNLLMSSPSLENVSFEFVSLKGQKLLNDENINTRPAIRLQHLKKLRIDSCDKSFADLLLPKIICRSSSEISLSIDRAENVAVVSSLPTYLKPVLQISVFLSASSERFKNDNFYPLDIAFALEFHTDDSPYYRIEFSDSSHPHMRAEDATAILCDLAKWPDFTELKEVLISIRHLPSAKDLTDLLTAWNQVEDITIRTLDLAPFLTALKSKGFLLPRCPFLRTLDIRRCRFDPYELKEVVERRKEWNSKLQLLQLTPDDQINYIPIQHMCGDLIIQDLKEAVEEYDGEDGYWTSSSRESENGEEGDYDVEDVDEDHGSECVCEHCVNYDVYRTHLWALP